MPPDDERNATHPSPAEQRRAAVAEHVGRAAEDFTKADLQAIADGGLMDANRIYLPAGRLSEAEARAREARILRGESQ
jgi:hypothetical protein